MSVGYILILAILILGGVIATVGDHLGTRIGKARLSLFNLRPRKTAVLVTILTGTVISASTLGILLATSGPLRTGILDIEQVQRRLRKTREALKITDAQKLKVESELTRAKAEQVEAQRRLDNINQSLNAAITRQSRTQAERDRAKNERDRAQIERDRALVALNRQRSTLLAEIRQIQAERRAILQQRDEVKAQRDKEIAARDLAISMRETLLRDLEAQQEYLAREVQRLERESLGLRQGNFALQRGQVLASGVIRIVDPAATRQVVDKFLQEANRTAWQSTQPGASNQDGAIIQITQPEVDQLIDEIDDGQDYVVRILAAANYLVGEKQIRVFADAVRNQVVFLAGDVVATTSLDPSAMTTEQIQERINLLIASSNFRARRLGLLNDTVQIGRIQNVLNFIEQLKEYKQSIEIKTVTAEVTYTAGPLKIKMVAVKDGEVLFGTN
jgi:uncharacterized protein (DUF3084 family)